MKIVVTGFLAERRFSYTTTDTAAPGPVAVVKVVSVPTDFSAKAIVQQAAAQLVPLATPPQRLHVQEFRVQAFRQ